MDMLKLQLREGSRALERSLEGGSFAPKAAYVPTPENADIHHAA